MAVIICSANLKGGVGKTTIALNLGAQFHREGFKVMVVDLDPQATASAWSALASELEHDGPPVIAMKGRSLRRDLERVTKGMDVVLLDCPPRLGPETRAAMVVSDLILVPLIPGPESVWALDETAELIEEARALRPEIKSAIVFNRSDWSKLSAGTREALEASDIVLLQSKVGARVAFGEAASQGQGVAAHAPSSVAAKEIAQLAEEVLKRAQE